VRVVLSAGAGTPATNAVGRIADGRRRKAPLHGTPCDAGLGAGLVIMPTNAALLEACQERLDYHFDDVSLLQAAMTHASSSSCRRDSNERLEFLGDAVLDLVVCQNLYERLPQALEGELTKIKSAVVSRRICARVADRLRLTEALKLGQGMEPGEQLPRSLAAAVLEAVIAAIYLDGGLEPVRDFILRHMEPEIRRASQSDHQYNFKSQLQQYAQRHLHATPLYELLDEKGPDHAKCFEVAVSVGHRQFPGAWGPNKKDAEQKAAWIALSQLGVVKGEFPETDAGADARSA
jgi:ribonuclease-3